VRIIGFVARDAFPNASPPPHPSANDLSLPLIGAVVADHPADPLEVWELSYTFSDPDGASALMRTFRVSSGPVDITDPTGHHLLQASPEPVPSSSADDSIGFSQTYPPDDGKHEHVIGYAMRTGRHVLQVTIRGGQHLARSTAEEIAMMASSQLATAC
jgi:hypothetical protein